MKASEIYEIYREARDEADNAAKVRDDYAGKHDGEIDSTLRSIAQYKDGFAEGIHIVYVMQWRFEIEECVLMIGATDA